jgi:hypothetical protein
MILKRVERANKAKLKWGDTQTSNKRRTIISSQQTGASNYARQDIIIPEPADRVPEKPRLEVVPENE